MVMWKFKECPRCGGDIFLDRDLVSWYEQCLQCSYRHDLRSLVDFHEQLAQRKKEPARAGGNRLKRNPVYLAQDNAT